MKEIHVDKQDIMAVWRAQCAAMDAGDPDALRACFAPDATLTHMTGYIQPLEEWLEGIRRREFVYHRLEEHHTELHTVKGGRAHLIGRITTGITEDGSGQTWPLTCDQNYARVGGRWLCTDSRVIFGH